MTDSLSSVLLNLILKDFFPRELQMQGVLIKYSELQPNLLICQKV